MAFKFIRWTGVLNYQRIIKLSNIIKDFQLDVRYICLNRVLETCSGKVISFCFQIPNTGSLPCVEYMFFNVSINMIKWISCLLWKMLDGKVYPYAILLDSLYCCIYIISPIFPRLFALGIFVSSKQHSVFGKEGKRLSNRKKSLIQIGNASRAVAELYFCWFQKRLVLSWNSNYWQTYLVSFQAFPMWWNHLKIYWKNSSP